MKCGGGGWLAHISWIYLVFAEHYAHVPKLPTPIRLSSTAYPIITFDCDPIVCSMLHRFLIYFLCRTPITHQPPSTPLSNSLYAITTFESVFNVALIRHALHFSSFLLFFFNSLCDTFDNNIRLQSDCQHPFNVSFSSIPFWSDNIEFLEMSQFSHKIM